MTSFVSGDSVFHDGTPIYNSPMVVNNSGGGVNIDTHNSGMGVNLVIQGNGPDQIFTSFMNDSIKTGAGDDFVYSGFGIDNIDGGAGDDSLIGGRGTDILIGAAGDDSLIGGVGDDTLIGGVGDDTLIGGKGSDELFGGAGDDTLKGGKGDDLIRGGAGNDIIIGGKGADTFELIGDLDGYFFDRIRDFDPNEGDKLVIELENTGGVASYDSDTGEVKVTDSLGTESVVAKIDPNLNVDVENLGENRWNLM